MGAVGGGGGDGVGQSLGERMEVVVSDCGGWVVVVVMVLGRV